MLKTHLNLLDIISTTEYLPPENASSQAIGDDFEVWVCRFLEKHLGYQVIDCSERRLLSSYSFQKKVIFSSIINLFPSDLVRDMRKKLDEPERMRYVFRFPKKQNLIIFQPWSGRTPDVLIVCNNFVIPIECKTAKDGKFCFGDSTPKNGYRFLLANLKKKKVKHSWGKNIEYPTKHPMISKMILKHIEDAKKIKAAIAKIWFNFDGIQVKFTHRGRHQFHPSKQIW